MKISTLAQTFYLIAPMNSYKRNFHPYTYFIVLIASLLLLSHNSLQSQTRQPRQVKNVILMISDGTSLSTVSLARWYQRMLLPDSLHLAIDPYTGATVITFCSNAPTGDSAPTACCYLTGMPSITGFIGTYPYDDGPNNLVPIDPALAYSPLATLFEAARLEQGKSTGIVVTCQYPHATPANCAAHHENRNSYPLLAKQMAHNEIDVLIGGGTKYLTEEDSLFLVSKGYTILFDDVKALRSDKSQKLWSLFNPKALPYEIDRDAAEFPSLAESTRIAIEKLNQNSKGFVLMVEGSKVDWAAHANDPAAMAKEFLAFDAACKMALNFAKQNGETAVIITADHCTGGVAIGRNAWPRYDEYPASELLGQLMRYRSSAEALAKKIKKTQPEALDTLFQAECGFSLSDSERNMLYNSQHYPLSPIKKENRDNSSFLPHDGSLEYLVATILNGRTPIAFSTHGHTAEEVWAAFYHPQGDTPRGVIYNTELHRYMASLLGYPQGLKNVTEKYFAPHTAVFPKASFTIDTTSNPSTPSLTVKRGRAKIIAYANTNRIVVNGVGRDIPSLIVYSAPTKTFFLPKSLADLAK